MKRIIIVLIFLASFKSLSQSSKDSVRLFNGIKIPKYQQNFFSHKHPMFRTRVVLKGGDILDGFTQNLFYSKSEIRFRKNIKDKHFTTLNPKNLKEIHLLKNDSTVDIFKFKAVKDKGVRLLKVLVENENGYSIYVSLNLLDLGYGESVESVSLYLIGKKNSDNVIEILNRSSGTGKNKFKKNAEAIFKNCPSLIKKIETKYFGKKDIRKIVKYYNLNCG